MVNLKVNYDEYIPLRDIVFKHFVRQLLPEI